MKTEIVKQTQFEDLELKPKKTKWSKISETLTTVIIVCTTIKEIIDIIEKYDSGNIKN